VPPGEDVSEPVYGAPARWIEAPQADSVVIEGFTIVTPVEVLATHLLETVKRNLSRLMTLKSLRRLLDELSALSDPARAEANRRFFDELIPERVPVDLLLSVLKLLLEERVSVRNLPLILEAIAEARSGQTSTEAIAEHVRQQLGFQIVAELRRRDGTVPLVQLDPDWERTFAAYEVEAERGRPDVALPPEDFNRLAAAVAERIAEIGETGAYPALITSVRRRRFLRTVLTAKGISNPVLSFEELGLDARPALLGTVAV
jgi:flagellar biosynthesis protein FlhA